MSKLTLTTASWGAPKSLASIPLLPAIAAKNVSTFVNITRIAQTRDVQYTVEKEPQDSVDQMAWDVYKKIEPRYSDANRRLAK